MAGPVGIYVHMPLERGRLHEPCPFSPGVLALALLLSMPSGTSLSSPLLPFVPSGFLPSLMTLTEMDNPAASFSLGELQARYVLFSLHTQAITPPMGSLIHLPALSLTPLCTPEVSHLMNRYASW